MVPKGYTAITLFPFVFIKHDFLKGDKRFVNHEKIHLRQQLELLILPFFVWYALEFLIRYLHYRCCSLAYRNISFEQEAYAHEGSLGYLNRLPFWSFMRYL